MTIKDFGGLFSDSLQKIKVYDTNKKNDVYKGNIYEGTLHDCPDEILEMNICVIDTMFNPTNTVVIRAE